MPDPLREILPLWLLGMEIEQSRVKIGLSLAHRHFLQDFCPQIASEL